MNKGQLRHYMTHCGYFFNRIYLRSWLLENNLFFPEGLAFEDSYFNTMTALYAKSVVVTEKGGYHYFQRENSTSRNRNRSHLYDKIRIAEKVWEDAKARRIYEAYRDEIDIKCVSTLASTLFHVCLGSFDKADPAQLKRIKDILKKHGAGYRKNPYYTELDLTQRWFLNINMVSSWLVVLAYRMGAQRWIGTGEAVIQKLKRK